MNDFFNYRTDKALVTTRARSIGKELLWSANTSMFGISFRKKPDFEALVIIVLCDQ
eukprot:CAMPEP_0170085612 /NCGR_PEP_ID=MMETSP0019_2-20121128/20449_1 /TAXON_ID=98059 /ORGANISM="Dinobryon sp., Strain UTEXLB2267" /LENGTH=55 /DNA_ID=CAMNT_0010302155 /DNA_START=1 /DNA_END=168 /DNA_ORIENTATION=+